MAPSTRSGRTPLAVLSTPTPASPQPLKRTGLRPHTSSSLLWPNDSPRGASSSRRPLASPAPLADARPSTSSSTATLPRTTIHPPSSPHTTSPSRPRLSRSTTGSHGSGGSGSASTSKLDVVGSPLARRSPRVKRTLSSTIPSSTSSSASTSAPEPSPTCSRPVTPDLFDPAFFLYAPPSKAGSSNVPQAGTGAADGTAGCGFDVYSDRPSDFVLAALLSNRQLPPLPIPPSTGSIDSVGEGEQDDGLKENVVPSIIVLSSGSQPMVPSPLKRRRSISLSSVVSDGTAKGKNKASSIGAVEEVDRALALDFNSDDDGEEVEGVEEIEREGTPSPPKKKTRTPTPPPSTTTMAGAVGGTWMLSPARAGVKGKEWRRGERSSPRFVGARGGS